MGMHTNNPSNVRQEDHEFKVSLGYILRLSQKRKKLIYTSLCPHMDKQK
jgi:hypothetical protein